MAGTLLDRLITRDLGRGMVVVSVQGHDLGRLYVVLRVDGRYVELSDGRLRPVDKLKRKHGRHVRVLAAPVDGEGLTRRLAGLRPDEQNKKIRCLIKGINVRGTKEEAHG